MTDRRWALVCRCLIAIITRLQALSRHAGERSVDSEGDRLVQELLDNMLADQLAPPGFISDTIRRT